MEEYYKKKYRDEIDELLEELASNEEDAKIISNTKKTHKEGLQEIIDTNKELI